jgi:hypothetical protein
MQLSEKIFSLKLRIFAIAAPSPAIATLSQHYRCTIASYRNTIAAPSQHYRQPAIATLSQHYRQRSQHYRNTIAALSLHYRSTIATLSLHYRCTIASYRSTIASDRTFDKKKLAVVPNIDMWYHR